MQLTFLTAPVPLTKTISYSERDDSYTTAPYPLVQRVTSHVSNVNTIADFAAALKEYSAKGACLLKGNLDKMLEKESRASHTLEQLHEWIVFDFDGVDCAPTHDGALGAVGRYLPEYARNIDCIIQLSSSAHRPDARRLSAHVFCQLDTPVDTRTLTEWITWINFNSELCGEISLTESGMGLHYPLDRTVASPSKLLYIAPPRCIGFTAAVSDPIHVVRGKHRKLDIRKFQPTPRHVIDTKLNELRAAANLPERQYKTRQVQGLEILLDAEPCTVHGIRPSGDGYIRFNMNGGDSYAYFINVREPGLIHNFKGEPLLQTVQVAPDLYKSLVKAAKSLPPTIRPVTIEPLAFYATNRQSTIYIGSYDREHDVLRVDPSNAAAATSWMSNFGVPMRQALPHYDLTYDMTSDIRFEDGYPVINLYKRTDYIKAYADLPRAIPCEAESLHQIQVEAPTLWRVMYSALGSNTSAALYFINWLSAIFQRRTRTESAWVLHGNQGTGKGMVINYIMRPLFGAENVTQQLYSLLNTNHNSYMEGKLVVVFNEAALSRSLDWTAIRSKLYDWITEPQITINPKGVDERAVNNFSNIILCSNDARPVQIEAGDRRFNVGEFQPERLFLRANEMADLVEGEQLGFLARILGSWQVNDDMLLRPYSGEAKERIFEATHSLIDAIAFAIKTGDAQFFLDNRPDAVQLRTDFGGKMLPVREYDALLRAMADHTCNVLTQSDIYTLFRMVAMTDKAFPDNKAAQRRIYQRHGFLDTKAVKCKRQKKTVRGLEAKWRVDADLIAQIKETLGEETPTGTVTPLMRKAK